MRMNKVFLDYVKKDGRVAVSACMSPSTGVHSLPDVIDLFAQVEDRRGLVDSVCGLISKVEEGDRQWILNISQLASTMNAFCLGETIEIPHVDYDYRDAMGKSVERMTPSGIPDLPIVGDMTKQYIQ